MGQRYGSVVKKTARKYSQPFPQWFIWKKIQKIAVFNQYLVLSRKRHKIWPTYTRPTQRCKL